MKKVFLSLLVASLMLAGCGKDDYKDDSKKSPLSSLEGTSWSQTFRSGFGEYTMVLDFRANGDGVYSFLQTDPTGKRSTEFHTPVFRYYYYDTEIGGDFGWVMEKSKYIGSGKVFGVSEAYSTSPSYPVSYERQIFGDDYQVNIYSQMTDGSSNNMVYDYLLNKIISLNGKAYTHNYTSAEIEMLTKIKSAIDAQIKDMESVVSTIHKRGYCKIESVTETTLVLKDESNGDKMTFTRRN